MPSMEEIKSLAGRIRWRSVLALILFVVLVYVLVRSFPGGYQTSQNGAIGIRVQVDPASVSPGGSAVMDVELKNFGEKSEVTVIVTGETYSKNLLFEDSSAQKYGSESIGIGPQETRKLKFKVKSKPEIIEGTYNIEFTAVPAGEVVGAKTRASLVVEKGV
jgi:hypothetical protein